MDISNINIILAPGVAGMIIWFLRWVVTRWEINEAAKREAEVKIADRQAMALDRIANRVDDHTTKDLEHHAEVKETVVTRIAELDKTIARMDAKLDAWTTPIEASEHPSERRRRAVAPPKSIQVP